MVGPLPQTTSGNTHTFGVADYFSKFVRLFPIRIANAKTICKLLEKEICLVFGVPQIIILDNGRQVVSRSCKDLCSKYGVTLRYDANYHVQADSIERVNRIVKTMLGTYVEPSFLGCAFGTC